MFKRFLVKILNKVEITLKRREKSLVIITSIRDEYIYWKKCLEAILQSIKLDKFDKSVLRDLLSYMSSISYNKLKYLAHSALLWNLSHGML